MSQEIDERVVEMRFKNSDFEKHANESISTLDKLESKLSFPNAEKNMKSLATTITALPFGALEKSVDSVTVKFSAMQVAAITALERITNKALDAGEALVKSLSIDQISAGFSKYEQKTTAVQTIVSATGKTVEEVNTALSKLNWFTDETSYSFTDMVDNIGKFTSAGVELEDAMSAMMGIANEAAVSGQNAASASRAMYNFAQAIGTGAVKLLDWKSIENANMATVEFKQTIIDTAVELGELSEVAEGVYEVVNPTTKTDTEVTVSNFNSALSHGWFTSDVLVKTLSKYSDYAEQIYEITEEKGISAAEAMAEFGSEVETLGEKAFKAAQVAKTFTDAVEATKDAVSSQWMRTFEMIVGNLDEAMETWTELTNYLWDFFASPLESMNDFLEPILSVSNYQVLIDTLKEAGVAEDDFVKAFKKRAKEYGFAIDEMIEREGSLEDVIRNHGYAFIVQDALNDLADGAVTTTTVLEDLTDHYEEYVGVAMDVVRGKYLNGVEVRTQALADAGYEFSLIQPLVNKYMKNGTITMEDYIEVMGDLTEEQQKEIGLTDEQIQSIRNLANQTDDLINNTSLKKMTGRELIIDSFRNALKAVSKIIEVIKEAWNELFPPATQEQVYSIIEKIHEFSEKLILNDEQADKLKRTLKGLFAAFDIVRQVIAGVLRSGLKILGALFGETGLNVADLSANLGDQIVAFRNWLNEGDKIGVFFEALTYSILNAKATVQGWIDTFLESHPKIAAWLEGLQEAFDKFKANIKGFGSGIVNAIKSGDIKTALSYVASWFLEFRDTVVSYITGIDFSALTKKFQAAFTDPETGLTGAIDPLKNFFKNIFGGIIKFLKPAVSEVALWVKAFFNALNPMILVPIMISAAIISINRLGTTLKGVFDMLLPLEELKKKLVSTLDTIGKSLKRYIDTAAWTKRTQSLINFSIAIAILAGSIWILAQVPLEDIVTSMVAIAVFTTILIAFFKNVDNFSGTFKNVNTFFTSFLALAAVLGMVMTMLDTIQNVDQVTGFMLGITVIVTFVIPIFIAMMKAVGNKTIEGDADMGIKNAIKFGVILNLIAASFVILNYVETDGLFKKLVEVLAVIAVLETIIVVVAKIQKKNNLKTRSMDQMASTIIKMVVAMDLLVLSIKLIETVKVGDILEHIGSFISVFVMLRVLAGIASKFQAGSGGWQILALATGLLILVPAIKSFSEIKWYSLGKAIVGVGALLLVIKLIIQGSNLAGTNSAKAGVMVLLISFAVAALSLVIWGFTYLDQGKLWSSVLAMDTLLLFIGIVIACSSEAQSGIGKIVALTVLASILSGVVIALAAMDDGTNKAIKAVGAVSALMAAITICIKLLGSSNTLIDGKTLVAALEMAAFAAIIAGLLEMLQTIDTEGIVERASAISLALLAISGSAALLMNFQNLMTEWKVIGEVLGIVTVAFGAVGLLLLAFQAMNMDAAKVVANSSAISLAVVEIVAIMAALAGLGKIPGLKAALDTAISAADSMGLIIAVVALITLVFGSIDNAMIGLSGTDAYTFGSAIETGAKALTALGEAIGGFFGGIIGGFVGGIGKSITSSIEEMGQDMEDFSDHLVPISENFSTFCNNLADAHITVNDITSICEALATLTAADLMSALADWYSIFNGNDSWTSFGQGVNTFAKSLEPVAETAKDLDSKKLLIHLKNFAPVLESVARAFANIPDPYTHDELYSTGGNSIRILGSNIKEFASCLFGVSQYMQGTSIENIEKIIDPIEKLSSSFADIPLTGGAWDTFWHGDVAWSNLYTGLLGDDNSPGLVDTLIDVSDRLKEGHENLQYIEELDTPIRKLVNMKGSLEKTGGLVNIWKGETDWTSLSSGLVALGQTLITFGEQAYIIANGGVVNGRRLEASYSSLSRVITVFKTFCESLDSFANVNFSWTLNVDDSSKFDAYIAEVSKTLNAFGENFGGGAARVEQVKYALQAAEEVVKFATETVSPLNGDELTSFATDFHTFADEIDAAFKTLRNIEDEEWIELISAAWESSSESLKTAAVTVSDAAATITGEEIHILSASVEVSDAMATASEETTETLEAIEETSNSVISTISNGWNTLKETFTSGINFIKESFESLKNFNGLDSIMDVLADLGLDLDSLKEQLNFEEILGTDLTSQFESTIEELTSSLDLYDSDSDEYKNILDQLEEVKSEYSDYQTTRANALAAAEDAEYTAAQEEFDALLKDYIKGRKTQMEFDTEYTNLLAENTEYQAELLSYSLEQMQDYVQEMSDSFISAFEDEISEIRSKIDSTKSNINKSWSDQFTFVTNQDLHDEEISKYDDSLSKLNTQLERTKELYGENSINARYLQNEIAALEKQQEALNDEFDEETADEIVDVNIEDAWEKQVEQARKTIDEFDKLKARGILTDDMLDWIGELSPEEAYAISKKWNSMSDAELEEIKNTWNELQDVTDEYATKIYSSQIEDANAKLLRDATDWYNTLPEIMRPLAKTVLEDLDDAFSDETESTLNMFEKTGEDLITALRAGCGIGEDADMSTTATETGETLVESLALGIASEQDLLTDTVKDLVQNAFSEGIRSLTSPEFLEKWNAVKELLCDLGINPDSDPSEIISRVYNSASDLFDPSTIQTKQAEISVNKAASSFHENTGMLSADGTTTTGVSSMSFTQNIYSPTALNRTEIRRDTKNLFTLAGSNL